MKTKKEPCYKSVALTCEGSVITTVSWVIIPDSHNPQSRRWQAWERAGRLIRSRAQLACAYRRWRAAGGRKERGQDPLAALIRTALLEWLTEGGHKA